MTQKLPDEHFYIELGDKMQEELDNKRKDDTTYGESNEQKAPPTIHKIPDNVRQGDPDAYKPKLISIGPIHHNKDLEDLKWRYLRELVERSKDKNVNIYVASIGKVEQRARRQYSVNIGMNKTEFVKMLVLDGCFILEFLIKRAIGNVGPPWSEANWNLPMLRNDLFLLENQIPFFVLEMLYEMSFPDGLLLRESKAIALLDIALHYVSKDKVERANVQELMKMSQRKEDDSPKTIHHLLHLSYICQFKNFKRGNIIATLSKGAFRRVMKEIANFFIIAFYFFVSSLLMCKFPRCRSSKNRGDNEAPRSLPSATKLVDCGITFRKKNDGPSGCCLNLSFIDEDGVLEIPFLSIQQTTISLFRNLIAFEQCCPDVEKRFTAYAIFMDKIIDTPEDVAVLVKHGIIESKFGTNEDVADLFNNICKGTSLDYKKHYLVELFEKVNTYCGTDRHRWRAALVNGYFYNPWVVISFLAAILLLLLTIIGTVASIEQTVYTIKGYEKQYDEVPSPN